MELEKASDRSAGNKAIASNVSDWTLRGRVGRWVSGTASLFATAIFPPECQLCGEPLEGGGRLCEPCRECLVCEGNRCRRCSMPLPEVLPNDDCVRCRGKKWAFGNVLTLGPYQDDLRDVVVAIKKPSGEPLRQAVAELLAQKLVANVSKNTDAGAVLLPVPNHWSHSFGYAADTAGQLAFALSAFTGIPVVTGVVRRIRKTRKQGMLAWSDRTKNVAGAFKILDASRLTGRHIFLVDDVLTSGATAAEIAKLLRRGGAARVDVAVVARGTGTKSL